MVVEVPRWSNAKMEVMFCLRCLSTHDLATPVRKAEATRLQGCPLSSPSLATPQSDSVLTASGQTWSFTSCMLHCFTSEAPETQMPENF